MSHTGHPTTSEQARARRVRELLGLRLEQLRLAGFAHDEALSFVIGTVYATSRRRESWHNPGNCRLTVEGVLAGCAAKHWALEAIEIGLAEIKELLDT